MEYAKTHIFNRIFKDILIYLIRISTYTICFGNINRSVKISSKSLNLVPRNITLQIRYANKIEYFTYN